MMRSKPAPTYVQPSFTEGEARELLFAAEEAESSESDLNLEAAKRKLYVALSKFRLQQKRAMR